MSNNRKAVGATDNKAQQILKNTTCLASGRTVGLLTAAAVGAAIPMSAQAVPASLPVLDNIEHGTVDIRTYERLGLKVIDQDSQKAIINWSDFSIGAGKKAWFKQPNSSAIALNRVTGGNVSNILGKLTANGRIMLVNPNGILFGASSKIDVNSLIATTANISSANFLSDNFRFEGDPNSAALIENNGEITVEEGGIAALVAPNVRNNGVIQGKLAKISLAGGNSFAIDLYGDGLVQLEVARLDPIPEGEDDAEPELAFAAAALIQEGEGEGEGEGQEENNEEEGNTPTVENNNLIDAGEGTVLLTTNAAQEVVDGVINMGNVVQATNARIVGGEIILDAGNQGTVTVAGELDASGESVQSGYFKDPKDGGSITVIGGAVNIEESAELNADAHEEGNGGDVLVDSVTHTNYRGTATARGGEDAGNGGFIEISGDTFLYAGEVDVSAENGDGGTVLIDPVYINIADGDIVGAPEVNTVYEEWIEALSVAGINVVLTAKESITMEKLSDRELTGGAGDISLLANEDGSLIGAVVFERKKDAITTTTGNLYVLAGSGGIDIGDLKTGGVDISNPGTITVETIRVGGDISARDLVVTGSGAGAINVASKGAASFRNVAVGIGSTAEDATASVDIQARGEVNVKKAVNVMAIANAADAATSVDADADLSIRSATGVTLKRVTVNAIAQTGGTYAADVTADAYGEVVAPTVTTNGRVDVNANVVGSGEVPVELVVEFLGEITAGYDNAYGYYFEDEEGNPVDGSVIFGSTDGTPVGSKFSMLASDLSNLGFFLIPDGADKNDIADNDLVTFEQSGGKWRAYIGGEELDGAWKPAFFTNSDLHSWDKSQVTDSGAPGNQNWEDLARIKLFGFLPVSDKDFNDANFQVDILNHGSFDANANAELLINGRQGVTLNGKTNTSSLAAVSGTAYDSVAANTLSRILSGAGEVIANKMLRTSAVAAALNDTEVDPATVTASADSVVRGETGVTLKGYKVYSDAASTTLYSADVNSTANGRVVSQSGNVIATGNVRVDANAYGTGNVPIDVIVEFLSTKAGYDNSFGFFNTQTRDGEIVWADLKETERGDTFTATVADLKKHGFFLIPNGAKKNEIGDGDYVTFSKVEGEWTAFLGEEALNGSGAPAYFTMVNHADRGPNGAGTKFNPDGVDHSYDSETEGNMNWEDLYGGGDNDANDANFNLWTQEGDKSSIHSLAELRMHAANEDVILGKGARVTSDTVIRGTGYDEASAKALGFFKAGDDFQTEGNVFTRADVDYDGYTVGGLVFDDAPVFKIQVQEEEYDGPELKERPLFPSNNVSADSRIIILADGSNARGDAILNGNLRSVAKGTEVADDLHASIRVEVADDIVYGEGVQDPRATTKTRNGPNSNVQARVTSSDAEGNDRSILILRDQLDPNPEDEPEEPENTIPGGGGGGGNNDTIPGGDDTTPGGGDDTTPGGDDDGGSTGGGTTTGAPDLNQIFIDPLQRFLLSLRDAGIVGFLNQRPYFVNLGSLDLSLLGSGGNVPTNLSAEQLGALAPAAGGIGGDSSEISCANSYLNDAWTDTSAELCGTGEAE